MHNEYRGIYYYYSYPLGNKANSALDADLPLPPNVEEVRGNINNNNNLLMASGSKVGAISRNPLRAVSIMGAAT